MLYALIRQIDLRLIWWELTSREVDLLGVDLVGVDLVGVDLVGVDFVVVDLVEGHQLP